MKKKTDNVVKLRVVENDGQPGEPNTALIDHLKELLGRAETGELVALATAAVKSNGFPSLSYVRGYNNAPFVLIAAVRLMELEMINTFREDYRQ